MNTAFFHNRKVYFLGAILLIALAAFTIYYCDNQVELTAQGKTFSVIEDAPHYHVGLLLGTGKYLKRGAVNPYYHYRIEAASKLMISGKVDYMVISGDNSRHDYNEPEMMKMDLVKAGIDSNRIYLDYAGFRTFDSMVRLREIFSQDTVMVISQKFHNERALFIADREGMTAVGFNAQDVRAATGFRTQLREKFARVKVFVDYIFNVEPKFFGPKVNIP